ncbi:hypothetical protein CMI47_08185 [Candidatus Pacearchaeota archaeon]|nr:hypothetical protein [Candidatus Pacearchaeota archaeon]|tara:strand:+ start:422 stop:718 length:297 start_codon:yes stop_codon:yes gene_type:complete
MATGRYAFTPKILGRKIYATSQGSSRIFKAIGSGVLEHTTTTLKENQRLDHISGRVYGSSDLWWVIAAASGIGWGLQVPPGTIIKIPTNINDVFSLLR